MNKFKKVALTALGASLAATSANAGDVSISGSMVASYSKGSGYHTTGNPLDHQKEWGNVIINGKKCKRDTDTLDTFVDSSWYPLRYPSPKSKEPINKKEVQRYLNKIIFCKFHILQNIIFICEIWKVKYILTVK